ncbi:CoA pyrophosphatase [Natronomonas gomsonensis]|jgi:8-oxo-dGTP pyrophosphatase MutT (NUDIX family)|uniref:NUDIX hydrolase n=1 Tax=Natronomonas gomsonensis TaxID=1046043 RepID=UPI0020CA891A|nr:CoA pyrophosphatase [Natronomonas gomsonensis]MCY4731744.1 CoA pyrophosphatase [Natronomonas gomsonensis]
MNWERLIAYAPGEITGAEREAAVLAPIVSRSDGEYLLFTKRADHLGEHPGQMSFPGGGREPEDADLEATAKREGNEEIGLRPEEVEVIGRLDDIPTVTDYAVRPFVAKIPDREYTPDESEVAEIAVLAIDDLTDLDNYDSESRDHPHYGEIRVHYFRVDGYTVWGATGRMLAQFLELATDWEMPEDPDRVVDPDAEFPV